LACAEIRAVARKQNRRRVELAEPSAARRTNTSPRLTKSPDGRTREERLARAKTGGVARKQNGQRAWIPEQFRQAGAAGAPARFAAEARRPPRSRSTPHAAPFAVSADPIRELLESTKVIAVVGLSSRRSRPSNGVSRYLQAAGYRVIPVNPNETEVLGERAYARLEDVPERVDIVDIFRRSEFVPEIVESAVRIGARAVWMQEGVIHEAAAARARLAGLVVVMDRCILKDHHARFAA
jgi:hypothetical protein